MPRDKFQSPAWFYEHETGDIRALLLWLRHIPLLFWLALLFLHSAPSFNYAHPLRQKGWHLILLNKIKRRLVLWRHHKAVRGSFYCGDKPVSEPLCCPIKHQTASEVGRQFQRSLYRWRSYAEEPGSMLGRGTPWYLISTTFSRNRSKARSVLIRSERPALRFRYPLDKRLREPQLCDKHRNPYTYGQFSLFSYHTVQ
jgi:hypothetical protein